MSSFDRWVQNMKHRESARNRAFRIGYAVRDATYGDLTYFVEFVSERGELIRRIADELNLSRTEAEARYERWKFYAEMILALMPSREDDTTDDLIDD